jgi:hypothetical protein
MAIPLLVADLSSVDNFTKEHKSLIKKIISDYEGCIILLEGDALEEVAPLASKIRQEMGGDAKIRMIYVPKFDHLLLEEGANKVIKIVDKKLDKI